MQKLVYCPGLILQVATAAAQRFFLLVDIGLPLPPPPTDLLDPPLLPCTAKQ